ncbi:MAG: hypothetical protein IKH55_04670 [Fibrobacter sp.]|nr:hypothetical protein [Fibrobacter sp.]
MKYFATRNADSSETVTINSQVSFYKTDTFIRNKYMTYEYDLHESKEAGKWEIVDGLLANGKLSEEEIAIISGFPMEDILKRKAKLTK